VAGSGAQRRAAGRGRGDPARRAAADRDEDLFEAELSDGDNPALVAELRQLIARNPLRERPGRCSCGRCTPPGGRPRRWRLFEEARTLLADELGTDPSPELTETAHGGAALGGRPKTRRRALPRS